MSRIGKKPITLPQGVKVQVQGNVVTVQGPKGKVDNHLPGGVKLEQKDGHIHVTREDDSKVAADMRGLRPPDPYKNKGVRYAGEKLKKKVGKTGAK